MKTIKALFLGVCALSLSGCMTTHSVMEKAKEQPAYYLAVPATVPIDIATFPIQIAMFSALAHLH